MKKRKFLFVCYANQNRSKTGERIFRELLEERGYKVSDDVDARRGRVVLSAGFETNGEGRQLSKELADKFDEIFVMSRGRSEELTETYKQDPRKIVILDIPDVYRKDDPELVGLLRLKLSEYLELEGY